MWKEEKKVPATKDKEELKKEEEKSTVTVIPTVDIALENKILKEWDSCEVSKENFARIKHLVK